MMGTCEKDTKASLKGFPPGNSETISTSKDIIIIRYNPLNKI